MVVIHFYYRASAHWRAILIKQICPSVRYVPVSDENGLTYRHSFFHRTVAQSFCSIKHVHEIQTGSAPAAAGALNTDGVYQFPDFRPISRYIAQMEGELELVCGLSNGAISNDLERTLTLFSRSHHPLTLNISQTATDTAIVIIEGE